MSYDLAEPPLVHLATIAMEVGEDMLAAHKAMGAISFEDAAAAGAVLHGAAAVFLTGFEFGLRTALAAGPGRTQALLGRLVSTARDAPPLETRERMMASDIDDILGVAEVTEAGWCPDCEGRVLFDAALMHLVCGGCGQLLRTKEGPL
jgi:hypothetical protein